MLQRKGSYQERNYSTFQCDNILFMISNYLLYSIVLKVSKKSIESFNTFNTTIKQIISEIIVVELYGK